MHGIIRQSDGFLAVDSLLGKGTRIRIYLPRHDGDAMAIPRLPVGDAAAAPVSMVAEVPAIVEPVVHSAPGGRTVLLVDDEDGVRRLAARALTKEGWTVLSAESGEAALALLAEQEEGARPVVILSDVVMPGMDGPSLVRAVREQFPGLPAILASGYAEEAVRGDLAAEDIAFLPKPYTLKVMLAAVRERALPGDLPG